MQYTAFISIVIFLLDIRSHFIPWHPNTVSLLFTFYPTPSFWEPWTRRARMARLCSPFPEPPFTPNRTNSSLSELHGLIHSPSSSCFDRQKTLRVLHLLPGLICRPPSRVWYLVAYHLARNSRWCLAVLLPLPPFRPLLHYSSQGWALFDYLYSSLGFLGLCKFYVDLAESLQCIPPITCRGLHLNDVISSISQNEPPTASNLPTVRERPCCRAFALKLNV